MRRDKDSVEVFTRYPLRNILTYNGTTVVHFVLGGAGIMLGYSSWLGYVLGSVYIVLALSEMYIHMPLKVCPNCVYYKLDNSLCISGLNVLSKKIAKPGSLKDFPNRARGLFCPNNLYIASLVLPILLMVPALIVNFSFALLGILLVVVALLAFRFLVIFTRIACVHCRAKNICPQARSMGLAST